MNARKVANRSRRDKNASESLMSYLGRKADRTVYTSFQRSLREVVG